MIPFDCLFVQDPKPFVEGRLLVLALLLPAFLLARLRSKALRGGLHSLLLTWAPLTFHLQYYYYVFVHVHEKVYVYFTGLLLIIFYGHYVLHRFQREQHIFNVFGIVATLPFVFLYPDKADLAYIIIVAHLVSFYVFTYFRWEFVRNLNSIYHLLRLMVPGRVAEIMAVSQESTEATEVFRPQERFTVCLCADWRGFQRMASTLPNDRVSELLENFYDQVLITLEKLVPSDNYYFHWNADELFVIFFAENGPPAETLKDAVNFAHAFAMESFRPPVESDAIKIRFDIGMAAGTGLLGLQGPKLMKKTTISGEVAGRAKRFQNEAKRLRRTLGDDSAPILVVDEQLHAASQASGLFVSAPFRRIQAQSKDIIDLTCYFWSRESTDSRQRAA